MMRIYTILTIVFFVFQIGSSQNTPYAFNTGLLDLGEIVKGEKASGQFTFQNMSQELLKIELVSSCECTTVKWPRKAIAPGESGIISFVFDSSKKDVEEDIDIDVYFENSDPKTGIPYFEILRYKYQYKID